MRNHHIDAIGICRGRGGEEGSEAKKEEGGWGRRKKRTFLNFYILGLFSLKEKREKEERNYEKCRASDDTFKLSKDNKRKIWIDIKMKKDEEIWRLGERRKKIPRSEMVERIEEE